jgi:hypothetical protein
MVGPLFRKSEIISLNFGEIEKILFFKEFDKTAKVLIDRWLIVHTLIAGESTLSSISIDLCESDRCLVIPSLNGGCAILQNFR